MNNNNYDIIVRSDGEIWLLIFENNFKKDNVHFCIDNNRLKLVYPDNEKINYGKLDKNKFKVLSSRNKILVSEIDCDKDSITNGEIKDSYVIEKY